MKKAHSVSSGFTLIEMLLVLAITTAVGAALFASFLIGKQSYLSADSYVQVQQEARRAIDVMDRELRSAQGTAVVTVNNPASIQFPIALGYDLAAPCPTDSICWGARDQGNVNQMNWTVRYRVNGTQLVRELLNAAGGVQPGARVLANDIDAAVTQFAYDAAANTVAISLGVRINSAQLPGGSMSVAPNQLTTRVKLRNDG